MSPRPTRRVRRTTFCVVPSCTNDSKKLLKWEKEKCNSDFFRRRPRLIIFQKDCSLCQKKQKPFSLKCFPRTGTTDTYKYHQLWVCLIFGRESNFAARSNHRVCSEHFSLHVTNGVGLALPVVNIGKCESEIRKMVDEYSNSFHELKKIMQRKSKLSDISQPSSCEETCVDQEPFVRRALFNVALNSVTLMLPIFQKPGRVRKCVVPGCTSNSSDLKIWKGPICNQNHTSSALLNGRHSSKSPINVSQGDFEQCTPPYYLRIFPSGNSLEQSQRRKLWKEIVFGSGHKFIPTTHKSVCSKHFNLDATNGIPIPVLNVGRTLSELQGLFAKYAEVLTLCELSGPSKIKLSFDARKKLQCQSKSTSFHDSNNAPALQMPVRFYVLTLFWYFYIWKLWHQIFAEVCLNRI